MSENGRWGIHMRKLVMIGLAVLIAVLFAQVLWEATAQTKADRILTSNPLQFQVLEPVY